MACTGQLRRAKRQARSVRPLARRCPVAATMAIAFELSPVAMTRASPYWLADSRGETGVMSFMIDRQDRVYQANLGEESAAKAQEITRFTPRLTPAGRWQNLKNARLHSRNRAFSFT